MRGVLQVNFKVVYFLRELHGNYTYSKKIDVYEKRNWWSLNKFLYPLSKKKRKDVYTDPKLLAPITLVSQTESVTF